MELLLLDDEHELPSAMHVPLKQHPLAHELPAQQGSPTSPHRAQRLDEEQTVPEMQRSVPPLPEQHCSPALPQVEHRPLRQARPWPQEVPQQG